MTDPIPESHLVADLGRVGGIVDGAPTTAQYREHGRYSVPTFQNRLGGWVDALQEAGFDVNYADRVSDPIPKDEVIDDIRRLGEEVDGLPRSTDYRHHGTYCCETVFQKFGTWGAALEAAGFDTTDYDPSPGKRSDTTADEKAELEQQREERGIPKTHLSDAMGRSTGYWSLALREGALSQEAAEDARAVFEYYDEHGYIPLPREIGADSQGATP